MNEDTTLLLGSKCTSPAIVYCIARNLLTSLKANFEHSARQHSQDALRATLKFRMHNHSHNPINTRMTVDAIVMGSVIATAKMIWGLDGRLRSVVYVVR